MPESMDGESNSEVDLKKSECEEDVQVKYKGVRQRKWGKFVSEIKDPIKRGNVWLGTFDSAIEAAKAYDKAAFEMRGSKANLNFPLELTISPVESIDATKTKPNTVVRGGRKRRKVIRELVAVVNAMEEKPNGDDSDPIDDVKLHDGSGPSSPPSVHGSGRSISGQSMPVTTDKKEYFKWTDESLVAMCDILNRHLTSNGRNCPFKWTEHQLEFEKLIHHKFKSFTALRSKHDAMRARYNLWRSLTVGETCLRWDKTTGTLDCSDDWWENKIKENPEFKLIRKKQPSRELQEAWDQLFENADANVVDPNKSNQVPHVKLEDDDDRSLNNDGVSSEHTLHSSQLGNVEIEEATSISNFINKARREDGLPPNQGDVCKTRETERTKTLKELMTRQNATQQSALEIKKTTRVNQVGNSSISASISVINRMVDEGLMTSCSELWCFAVNLFEDDVKRELFMSLPDDAGRLAWLQYKQNLGN